MTRMRLFEVDKLLSLPGCRWLAGASVLLSVATPLLVRGNEEVAGVPAMFVLPQVVQILQYTMLALGCLAAGHQFGTGVWRTTLLATPRRAAVVAVQAIVIAGAAGVLAVMSVVSFLSVATLAGMPASDGDLAHATGAVLYLALLSLLAWAVTLTCRSVVVALGSLSGSLLIAPLLAQTIPPFGYLPGAAGSALAGSLMPGHPGASALWLLLWVGAAFVAATLTARFRDCGE